MLNYNLLSAATVLGDRVRNGVDETLGSLDDLMIDFTTGRIVYAVISVGGFLGIGNKLFAVPLDLLQLDDKNREFILDMDKETLDKAPGFDKDNWPDLSEREWQVEVHEYFGVTPYWKNPEVEARH